uniref:Uncharacterized protein n=1 Tax=Myotis myotis TaxID=51298 RepID=A0A7J7UCV9_MYOMY|nr:hypothetical protein mMyoMyo1_008763 [Myotis myotis]
MPRRGLLPATERTCLRDGHRGGRWCRHCPQPSPGHSPSLTPKSGYAAPRSFDSPAFGNGSPGVTTGFRFPRRHRRFPGEGRPSGYTAKGFPLLWPRLHQDRPVGWGLEDREGVASRGRRGRGAAGSRPVTQQHTRARPRTAGAGPLSAHSGRPAAGKRGREGLAASSTRPEGGCRGPRARRWGHASKPEVRPHGAGAWRGGERRRKSIRFRVLGRGMEETSGFNIVDKNPVHLLR